MATEQMASEHANAEHVSTEHVVTEQNTPVTYKKPLTKPVAGLAFVVFWAIAIVAWCLVGLSSDHATRGFIADIGVVFAALGVAAPFLQTMSNFITSLVLGLIGIALFALFGYGDVTLLVYGLRILVPFLALLAPINKISNGIRIFA